MCIRDSLEGGDFITTGDVDFIGQGLRTNAEAITQLLENKVLCGKKLVVVKEIGTIKNRCILIPTLILWLLKKQF